jgi:hypothetical protein
MNADPADTRSPHLDLEDLIAEVTGRAKDDRAREHLTHCEHCRAEAGRWDLVAGGVRGLTAATPEPAPPAWPRHTRPRVLTGPRRRTLMAAAAAALVLGAVGYGATTTLTRHPPGAVLTAVSGCATLEQANGTLERVSGSSLVIKTAGGRPVTVTTTASTSVSMSGALLSDITDGASVMVHGLGSGATITAAIVTVGPPFGAVNPPGFVTVQGTVSDASTAGFTVVTSSGTRVPVTTGGNTLVVVPHAGLGRLPTGSTIFALGDAGPDGTLSAKGVAALSQLPPGPGPRLHVSAHVHASVRDCSPGSIADAISAIGAGLVSEG